MFVFCGICEICDFSGSCEICEEIVMDYIIDYLLFGFFAIPLLKMMIGTWVCIDMGDHSVLIRLSSFVCGEWK